jgi:hypothetical protein
MSAEDGIEAFALAAVEHLGGAAEQEAQGLYTVLWPVGESDRLEARRLAFDPEAMEGAADAALVTLASPALEELVVLATASGRVARAFLPASASPSRATREQLARSYRFLDATWTPQAGRSWWLPSGIFLFCARYRADSHEEELHEVAVSLADGGLLRRLGAAIDRYGLVDEPVEAWPMLAELPAEAAYAAARGELERRLIAPLGRRRRELEARLGRESGRAAAYYEELGREVSEQLRGLPLEAPERDPLASKLRAIRVEQEGRLAELRRKYRLEAAVSLLSVLRLYLPRIVFSGTLAGKRDQAALALAWDPVEQAAEPTRCQRCRSLTYEVGLGRSGAVVCPPCLAAPPRRR